MSAAKDRRLGLGHLAFERIHMAAHQRLGKDHVPVLDRIDDPAAGLRLDIDANGAERQLALEGAARHRGGRGKQRHMLDRHFSRR